MDRIFRLNPSHRIRNRTSTPYPDPKGNGSWLSCENTTEDFFSILLEVGKKEA